MTTSKVLIVEDGPALARALCQALQSPQNGGYAVESCDCGETALEKLSETPFDVVICDLKLPGIDGFEVIEKGREIVPKIRSIMITASHSEQIEERAQTCADAYLPKPFALPDLVATIGSLIGERQLTQEDSIGVRP